MIYREASKSVAGVSAFPCTSCTCHQTEKLLQIWGEMESMSSVVSLAMTNAMTDCQARPFRIQQKGPVNTMLINCFGPSVFYWRAGILRLMHMSLKHGTCTRTSFVLPLSVILSWTVSGSAASLEAASPFGARDQGRFKNLDRDVLDVACTMLDKEPQESNLVPVVKSLWKT